MGGNVAPLRSLGGGGVVGSWELVYDAAHGELFTSCNCDNKITVFSRTATDPTMPERSITISMLRNIYAMLIDEAADTLWVVGINVQAAADRNRARRFGQCFPAALAADTPGHGSDRQVQLTTESGEIHVFARSESTSRQAIRVGAD